MHPLSAFFGWYLLFGIPFWLSSGLMRLTILRQQSIAAADWLLGILPWLVWFSLLAADSAGKSLSNVAVEALALGVAAALLHVVRAFVAHYAPPAWSSKAAATALATTCFVAAALWAFVPPLPE
jgi:hypothetical protein